MSAVSVSITKRYETTSVTGAAKIRAELVYTDSNQNEHENPNSGVISSLTVIVGYGTASAYTFTIPDKVTLTAISTIFTDIIADLDPDVDASDEITFS